LSSSFFSNEIITRFYKYMLNDRLAFFRETIISARQINLSFWKTSRTLVVLVYWLTTRLKI
jgi:hypothetical protein